MPVTLMLLGGAACVVAVALMVVDAVMVIGAGQTLSSREVRSRSTPVLTASAVVGSVGLIVFCAGAFLPA